MLGLVGIGHDLPADKALPSAQASRTVGKARCAAALHRTCRRLAVLWRARSFLTGIFEFIILNQKRVFDAAIAAFLRVFGFHQNFCCCRNKSCSLFLLFRYIYIFFFCVFFVVVLFLCFTVFSHTVGS